MTAGQQPAARRAAVLRVLLDDGEVRSEDRRVRVRHLHSGGAALIHFFADLPDLALGFFAGIFARVFGFFALPDFVLTFVSDLA